DHARGRARVQPAAALLQRPLDHGRVLSHARVVLGPRVHGGPVNIATEPAAERAPEVFRRAFGTEPHVLGLAPGRVNLIGEHVDYNGGIVLPAAIDRQVAVAARWRKAIRIRMLAVDRATDDEFRIDTAPARGEGWARYVRGIATLLVRAGYPIPGADIAFAGDV